MPAAEHQVHMDQLAQRGKECCAAGLPLRAWFNLLQQPWPGFRRDAADEPPHLWPMQTCMPLVNVQ